MAKNGFSKAKAEKICKRLAEGKSLRKICEDDSMPALSTVMAWATGNVKVAAAAKFPEQYARARELQADTFADEIVDIADTEPDSKKAKVRIEARKWVAGKQKPKKYGDKLKMEHTGEDGGPIEMTSSVVNRIWNENQEKLNDE